MVKKISKDTPLAEITLRRYEQPQNLGDRELVKKLCLSMGLLQPGDSRDVIVDVLHVLLSGRSTGKHLTSEEVRELVIKNRKSHNVELLGIASSNIRRQLKRLRDVFLVEKVKNQYRITEFASLEGAFKERFERYLLPSITERVTDYLKAADERFE